MIEALNFVCSDIKLVIVGDGPERKSLEGLVEKYKLQNKIDFKGRLPLVETRKVKVLSITLAYKAKFMLK